MSKRPENVAPPEEFYNAEEASKYAISSRMAAVQAELAERCLNLLNIPDEDTCSRLLLDIGCGTGISGGVLSQAGHHWIGIDISAPMLHVALDEEVDGDLLHADAGLGVAMRMGCLDGAISVSALQWLCVAENSSQSPHRRLNSFFGSLYAALRHSARAALQFYPDSAAQIDLITSAATRAGFSGGLLVDYPNSAKAKKFYLVLTAGPPLKGETAPRPLGVYDEGSVQHVQNESRRPLKNRARKGGKGLLLSRRNLVIEMKDRRRRQGHTERADTKYTGRKRRVKF